MSLALGFVAGTLLSGEKITIHLRLSSSNIDGLSQADAHSQMLIYFNGYVTRGQVPPEDNAPPDIPEPGSLVLITLGLMFFWARSRLVP